jgi:Mn-dependent DtxR family transcriptional regulator
VVKAFNRLADRGLAKRVYNHGIYITETGRVTAELINQMLKNAEVEKC